MRPAIAIRSLLFLFVLLVFSHGASAQIRVGISVGFAPPPLPVYDQPICPADGYIWTPGYWAYDDDDGYYWVPGTWVEAPQVGFLWTPGYWGWGGSSFVFYDGYWGPHIGFYGGINYGFGYGGFGYEGGRWEGGHFLYNTYVNHVDTTIIHNTYNTRITNVTENHVPFNGGSGGVNARPTSEQESYSREQHVGPVAAQTQHTQAARQNPQLRASVNQGKPPIAATARPGDFRGNVVQARQAGGEYYAPPGDATRGSSEARPGNEARSGAENRPENGAPTRPATNNHASELQPHTYTPPNTGNAASDKKYQQQQAKLATKQTQEHQKLQQQQEKEHQQAEKKNYNAAQKQQMEQRHTQQTQKVEQKHAAQQTQLQQRQAARQSTPAGGHPH